MPRYHLPDEPRPGTLAQNAVDPVWPLFGCVLVGAWFGLAWFAFNSFALGSPSWRREFGLIATALLGKALLLGTLTSAVGAGWLDAQSLRYALLTVVALGLACAYGLHVLQSRVFELFTYFGGEAKNGAVVLMAAMFMLRPYVNSWLGDGMLATVLR